MRSYKCSCGSGLDKYDLIDARGIFVAYVCDVCIDEVKSHFRPEIFNDFDYEATEPIEDE